LSLLAVAAAWSGEAEDSDRHEESYEPHRTAVGPLGVRLHGICSIQESRQRDADGWAFPTRLGAATPACAEAVIDAVKVGHCIGDAVAKNLDLLTIH
jgi:hypothetical protein